MPGWSRLAFCFQATRKYTLFYNDDSKCYVLFKDVTEVIDKLGGIDNLPQERNRHAIAL